MNHIEAWLSRHLGELEVNPMGEDIRVNVGTNQKVTVDKLYGPLAASEVRVWLDSTTAQWVVEYCNPTTEEWEEKARWYCQENWPD